MPGKFVCLQLAIVIGATACGLATSSRAAETKLPVIFTGGYETDPRDGGRPVALIAGALTVPPDVFRQAFSGVTPARGRAPSGEEQRRNKDALLKVLAPYKVTNERLDQVSDYYRYQPQKGERWPTTAAQAFAIVEDRNIKRIEIAKSGAGYNAPPKVTVKGFETTRFVARLKFDKDFKKNGGLEAIEPVLADKK